MQYLAMCNNPFTSTELTVCSVVSLSVVEQSGALLSGVTGRSSTASCLQPQAVVVCGSVLGVEGEGVMG